MTIIRFGLCLQKFNTVLIKNHNQLKIKINFFTFFSRHGNLMSLTTPSLSPVANFIACAAKCVQLM